MGKIKELETEIEQLKEGNSRINSISMSYFEKYERSRQQNKKLQDIIDGNKDLVRRAEGIKSQNEQLIEENEKINKSLESIAKDLAKYAVQLDNKEKKISELEKIIAGK